MLVLAKCFVHGTAATGIYAYLHTRSLRDALPIYKFATSPVCSGPFKFVERIAQDRIVLEKYDGYWDKANIHFQKIEFRPFIDATVRLDRKSTRLHSSH